MPSDITPDPDGTLTPIAPDGPDVLDAASLRAALQRLANKDAQIGRLVQAWVTLENVTKTLSNPFQVDLVSSYPSGEWTVVDNLGIQVPWPGIYEIEVSSVIQRATGEGAFVQMFLGYGASMVGSFTDIGYASGYRYDAGDAMPAVVVGGVPHIVVTNPATTRFVFLPGMDNLTPVIETLAPGQLHKIVITQIGDLP